MTQKVRKSGPSAGLGTRFLPATSDAQRMLPLVDKPRFNTVLKNSEGAPNSIIVTGRQVRDEII